MNSLIVEYRLFGSPKTEYINVNKDDLCGTATILDIICAWHNYGPGAGSEIRIIDLIAT